MNIKLLSGPLGALPLALLGLACGAIPVRAADAPLVISKPDVNAAVKLTDNGNTWTLDNGIVKATINKTSGNMPSLVYHGIETMAGGSVWEETPAEAAKVGGLTQSVTIDPAKNGGGRAEIAVKGVTGGQVGLSPGSPGAPATGTFNLDIEIRYALGRGDSGIYTYAVFSHPAAYGALSVPESRFIIFINRSFDWLSVDADRNMLACALRDWGTGVVVHAKEQRIMSQGVYKNSVEHKYSYNAVQYKIPAYGWSSTKDHVGIWFINPTIEFLSGGASKQELVCHFGDNANPTPIILDYWRGTHYAGARSATSPPAKNGTRSSVPSSSTATPSPIPGPPPIRIWPRWPRPPAIPPCRRPGKTTAPPSGRTRWARQKKKPPNGPMTGSVAWTIRTRTSAAPSRAASCSMTPRPRPPSCRTSPSGWRIRTMPPSASVDAGPWHAEAPPPPPLPPPPPPCSAAPGLAGRGGPGRGLVEWTHDAKFYQFWNDGDEEGNFNITTVRPGDYTLHAFADGVLGEFAQASITVAAGKTLDLAKLDWKPVRYGKQVWEIGYPDRTGGKFFKGDGDNYWLWGWCLRYPLLFPNDLTYTIGKSDYHKDWFFEQVPHAESLAFVNPAAKDPANQRFGWVKAESLDQYPQTDTVGPWKVYGRGRATTWTIKFNMDQAPHGRAALRFGLAGADGNGGLSVAVNGQNAGAIRPTATNALRYNTNKGVWQEQTLMFNAAMMKQGENAIALTVPAGDVTTGVVYDYLRLELDENAAPGAPPN